MSPVTKNGMFAASKLALTLVAWVIVAASLSEPGVAYAAEEVVDREQLAAYEQFALTHAGDARRGRALFLDEQRTKCAVCHKIGDQGGEAGPVLSHIGGKFDRPHLIESLLEPSRQIVEGYRTTVVVTKDGQVISGVVKAQAPDSISVADASGKTRAIGAADIDQQRESDISLMPDGLAKALTPEQFTDLIAYLEALRPPGQAKMGAGIVGPINVPAGLEVQTVATGLSGCTALETTADGRILVCEQVGRLRVIKDGRLLDDPFMTLPVDETWERGLIGVTVHPDFPKTPFVYACYVAREPYPHHRVSRFTAAGDVAKDGSELILLEGDDQRKLGGKVPAGHQGGALHFGLDGKLYVAIGEQTAETPSQDLDSLQGKILRLDSDGAIPSDNPFMARTTGKYGSIWAMGLRNPFTFAFQADSGEMLINDVGGKFEEVNRGKAGANYGWPVLEHGETGDERFVGPVHVYPQASIAGGDFAPTDDSWPPAFRGRYFFADFIHGWIKTLDPARPTDVKTFASGLRRPVDLRFARDGSLYVLLRNAWVIDDKFQGGTGSLLRIRSRSGSVPAVAVTSGPEPTTRIRFTEDTVDESAGNLAAYKIETPAATYFLEKSGGGLSSLVDRDGKDWLSFHPQPGSGAGGEYRGFPNAVHQQAGNYFHPRNETTDPVTTKVTSVRDDGVSILVESDNGLWAGRYDFGLTNCTFTMTRMPADKKYWVLYEGTPGGEYDDDDWWMTSAASRRQPLTQDHDGDIASSEWIAFGDAQSTRSLLLLHHEDDSFPDRFYQMQRKMTVFGFGRRGLNKFLNSVPQSFSIGLIEDNAYQSLAEAAASWRDSKSSARP